MLVSASITITPGLKSVAMAEFLCRSWYAAATVTYASLTIICVRRFLTCTKPIVCITVVVIFFIYASDIIIQGAMLKNTSLAWSNSMITRIPGSYYSLWLALICSLAILQITVLLSRIMIKGDGRDQTAAQWILASLTASYFSTAILSIEMTNPVPAFNAQPIISICCLAFCEIIGYTCRTRKLKPILSSAVDNDLQTVQHIQRILDDTTKSNDQVAQQLAIIPVLDSNTGHYVYRDHQALFIGNIQRFSWCTKLEQEVDRLVWLWPAPKIKKLS